MVSSVERNLGDVRTRDGHLTSHGRALLVPEIEGTSDDDDVDDRDRARDEDAGEMLPVPLRSRSLGPSG